MLVPAPVERSGGFDRRTCGVAPRFAATGAVARCLSDPAVGGRGGRPGHGTVKSAVLSDLAAGSDPTAPPVLTVDAAFEEDPVALHRAIQGAPVDPEDRGDTADVTAVFIEQASDITALQLVERGPVPQ